MTNKRVNTSDARRLAAAKGIKYTSAFRELEATPPADRHALVLAAEANARTQTPVTYTRRPQARPSNWYERVAADFALELLRSTPADQLTPPAGLLPAMTDASYVLIGVESVDAQYVDDYDGGDVLYNLSIILEVTVQGVLDRHIPLRNLVEEGYTPLAYSVNSPEVRLPVHRVLVELAGLYNRDNDDSWELQDLLGYDWLD